MAYLQQNNLAIKSRTILAHLLAQVVLLSDSLQVFRETLAKIEHFDCIALFRSLDDEEKGFLRQKDYQRIMGTSHRKLLTYAFSWMDTMKIGQISRLEFATFLLPKDNLELRELVAKRVETPQSQELQQVTLSFQMDIFSKMLMQIMNNQMKIIELRRALIKCEDYSIRGVMNAIDLHGHRWICGEDLFLFLKNFGVDVNMRQVEKLVEVINCSSEGKINEDQLKWTVEGLQNKNKSYLEKIKKSNKLQISHRSNTKIDEIQDHPQIKQFTLSQPINSELNNYYQKLVQEFKASEIQQQKMDELLLLQDKEINDQISKECEKFMTDFRLKRQLIRRQQQKEALLIQKQRQIKLIEQQRIAKMREEERRAQMMQDETRIRLFEEEKRRIRMLEDHRMETLISAKERQDRVVEAIRRSHELRRKQRLNKAVNSVIYTSPHFHKTQMSPQKKRSPLKKDYTNLTNLSRLTQVQSYRRATQASPAKLQDPSAYLSEANHLKDMIRKERQKEKEIQEKFASGKFNASKYSSRSEFYGSPNIRTKPEAYESIRDETFGESRMKSGNFPQKAPFSTAYQNRYATASSHFGPK